MISFLDGLVGVFLFWWGYIGFKRGFVEELSRLFGIIAAYIVAQSYTGPFVIRLRNLLNLDSWVLVMAGSALLFTVTLVSVRFFTQFLHQFIVTRSSRIADKILGVSFGAVKGSILIMLTVWGLGISPLNNWAEIMKRSSRFITAITTFGDKTFSALGIDGSLSNMGRLVPGVESDLHDGGLSQ